MNNPINIQTIIDSQLTAVLVVDGDLVVHFANTAAEQLLTLSKRRLKDARLDQLVEDISLDMRRIQRCIELEQSFTNSEVQIVIDGLPRWVDVSVTAFTLNRRILALMELRLIDQQKKISQELQQRAQQQAARELVRGLAHEIKNPLGGLRGAAQLYCGWLSTSQ